MNIVRRARLNAEVLEDRVCPALTIRLLPTMLMITGNPTGDIQITGVANNKVSLTDNSKALGTYNTSTLYLNLTSHLNKKVDINLGGFTLGGNITINAGLGLHTSPANTGVSVWNGTVGGSVSLTGGSGGEYFYLGLNSEGKNPSATTIRGNVTFAPRANGTPVTITNQSFNALDSQGTGVAPVVTIGGTVSATNADGVAIGQSTTVGKDVAVTAGNEPVTEVFILGTVNRNVSVVDGNGIPDLLSYDGVNLLGSTVNGSVSVNFGEGTALFAMDATSTVNGNVQIQSGSGSDTFTIDGTIAGFLSLNMGDGKNTLATTSAVVNGNVSITGGNGGNDLSTTIFSMVVGGNLTIKFGNGTNTIDLTTVPGGKLTYRGGNGSDTLTLDGVGSYLIDATFGTGTNIFDIDTAGLILSGIVRGSGGSNTITQGAGILTPSFTLLNF